MILLDWSNVIIGNIMVSQRYDKSLDEGLIRHLVLNNLRSYRKRFKKKYGELVICTDFHSSWRKEVFPFYKEESGLIYCNLYWVKIKKQWDLFIFVTLHTKVNRKQALHPMQENEDYQTLLFQSITDVL